MERRTDGASASQSQFDRQAASYSISQAHAAGDSLRVLARLAAESRFSRALDIATGPGFTAFEMAASSEHVLATDIAAGMIGEARRIAAERQLGNVAFAYVQAEALPFASGSFDLVTCRTATHHFVDLAGALAEISRVLGPGGVFLLADTCAPEEAAVAAWQHDVEGRRDTSHVRNLPPSEWQEVLDAAGLDADFTTETRVRLQFNDWTKRSGTPAAEIERLRADWENAPDEARIAFEIEPLGGGDFSFSWPCHVARARKRV